jgi:hypothetical protein
MDNFIARMYEWFGLFPGYSKDLDEFLRGLDYTCTQHLALHWYFYVAILMLTTTVVIFGLQYDLISIKRFKPRTEWELAAFMIAAFNFFIAFTIPFAAVLTARYCVLLKLSFFDCITFGVSNAGWSLVVFGVLSLVQRVVVRTKK